MFISDEISSLLQNMAARGSGASAMIAALKAQTPQEDFNYFFVIGAFRKAFDLRMPVLLLLQEAKCLGGPSYEDDELDALMGRHIRG